MMDTHFPNPVEHASILIEVCGTREAAQRAARDNQDFASTTEEYKYWHSVEAALTPEELCLAN
jgi:hypothetical protein